MNRPEQMVGVLKVLMLGDSAIGKTSLLRRFTEGSFDPHEKAHLSLDYKAKEIRLSEDIVKMNIWDVPNLKVYKNMAGTMGKGTNGIVLAYDCTNHESFDNLHEWIALIDQLPASDIVKVLVATKVDLDRGRKVSKEIGKNFAEKFGFEYCETSALNGENYSDPFITIASRFNQNHSISCSEMLSSHYLRKVDRDGHCYC